MSRTLKTITMLFALPSLSVSLGGCATTECVSDTTLQAKFGSAEAAALHREAVTRASNGDTDDVLRLTNAALDRNDLPKSAESLFTKLRAEAYMNTRQLNKSADDFDKVLSIGGLSESETKFLKTRVKKMRSGRFLPSNGAPRPLVIVPPTIPRKALTVGKSGFCVMQYNITKTGAVEDPRVQYCSDDMFMEESIRSIAMWKYNPKFIDRQAVRQTEVQTKVTYRVLDECGNLLPE